MASKKTAGGNIVDVFQKLLEKAQLGDEQAVEHILREFDPLIQKYSYVDNTPDEDLLAELRQAALLCIRRFKCDKDDMESFFREARDILAGDEPGIDSTSY